MTVEDDSQSLCKQTRSVHNMFINTPPVPRLNLSKTIAAVGETLTLNAEGSIDSDGDIIEYAWDFGDMATASGEEVTHEWQAPGTYTIRLRVTDDADLSNSAVIEETQIIINAPPVAQATYRAIIAAQEEVPFDGAVSSDPDGTIRKYVWNMGDGAEKEGEKITHAYADPGLYTVRLTVTDNTDTANNTTFTTFEVRVNQPPVPMAGDDQIVNSSLVKFDGSASSDTDDPIIDYVWDFGDGVSQQGKTVSHVYALPGTYTATLTVTDASQTLSAKQSDTVQITVNHPPIADAGGSQVISPGETVTLDGNFSTDPDGEITTYQWNVGENVELDGARVEYQYDQPGIYQVRLTVTDNVGATGVDYAIITVNAPPVADFYPIPRVAPGQVVKFDGSWSHDPDGAISRAVWDFGDDTPPQEGVTAEHAFAAPGRYSVTLSVEDNSSASAHTAAKTRVVEVNYAPKAEAGNDIRTCEQNVKFDASQSVDPDGDPLNYFWDFGDGERGQGRSVEHAYAKPGIYPVSLTVDDGQKVSNSQAYATLTAYVNAPPDAEIRLGRPSVCAGELALFDASQSSDLEKGRLRYVWDLGDGVAVEGINPVREYTEGGDYRIRLTVSDDSGLACNTTETETMLHVVDAPIARAGDDQTVCANSLVEFDGAASTGGGRRIKSYEWEFGDGQFGVGVNPGHVYAEAGDYTTRLLITVAGDGECSNASEDEVVIHVMAAPIAMFSVPKAACVGESLAFDANASTSSNGKITELTWDFGDETSATGATASHAYQAPGTYRAALRLQTDATGVCNSSEYAETIVINAVPTAVIQVAAADHAPVSGESYATERQTVLRFSGATSSDTDGHIAAYRWDFGDGSQANGAFVSHQYETPGDYPVMLEVTDNSGTACQSARSVMRIQVREPQIQAIAGPDNACVGLAATYQVSAESAEWQVNDGTTATGKEFEKTFERPGVYQIQAKVGADWMPVKEVTALELPELRLPARLDIFPNDSVAIQPAYDKSSGLPLLFQWEMGDGATLNAERAEHVYTQPGDYTAQLLLTMPDAPECLQKIYTIPVTVHTPPQVEIQTEPKEKFAGGARDAIVFTAAMQGKAAEWNYRWNFGDGEDAPGQSVSHAYRKSGTYAVTVTLSDALLRTSQTYTFSQEIEVKPR
ncbi:PKD domain protein [Candidatus Moduliflexus flocculans]|uniref:PKD domain protein n=1 Tax=Candidatus Moduliflexus flocculans TaxID=1499966 RepID=A0A081BR25_9BACT|nr:PKD domain protein [Candidatus Moduliflexus flocculans]